MNSNANFATPATSIITPVASLFHHVIPGLTQESDYESILKANRITVHDEIEEPPICLEIHRNDTVSTVCTLGNISMVMGSAKQGKTFVVSMALAAAIQNDIFQNTLRASLPADQNTVILFDTEQSRFHTKKVLDRICRLLHVEEPLNLIVYALRGLSPAERLNAIEYAIYNTPNIGFIVIDGIRDLVNSINDEEQATMITSKLLKWTAERKIHLLTVLHTNKNDNNARGHLGTELTNKCETVFLIGKSSSNKEEIIVKAEFTRDREFEPFAFKVDEQGLPYILEDWVQGNKSNAAATTKDLRPDNVPPETHADILKDVFSLKAEMLRSELRIAAQTNIARWRNKDIGVNKVDTWIMHWQQRGYITMTGTAGTRSAKYRNNAIKPN